MLDHLNPIAVNGCMHVQVGFRGGYAMAQALVSNTRLKTLNLAGNRISDSGNQLNVGAHFAGALRQNFTLSHLNLSANRLGPAAGVALAQSLAQNFTLDSINLANNRFDKVRACMHALYRYISSHGAVQFVFDMSTPECSSEAYPT